MSPADYLKSLYGWLNSLTAEQSLFLGMIGGMAIFLWARWMSAGPEWKTTAAVRKAFRLIALKVREAIRARSR